LNAWISIKMFCKTIRFLRRFSKQPSFSVENLSLLLANPQIKLSFSYLIYDTHSFGSKALHSLIVTVHSIKIRVRMSILHHYDAIFLKHSKFLYMAVFCILQNYETQNWASFACPWNVLRPNTYIFYLKTYIFGLKTYIPQFHNFVHFSFAKF